MKPGYPIKSSPFVLGSDLYFTQQSPKPDRILFCSFLAAAHWHPRKEDGAWMLCESCKCSYNNTAGTHCTLVCFVWPLGSWDSIFGACVKVSHWTHLWCLHKGISAKCQGCSSNRTSSGASHCSGLHHIPSSTSSFSCFSTWLKRFHV